MKKFTIVIAIIMFFILGNDNSTIVMIPNDAIRIRVIANSNGDRDVAVKEKLKDEIQPVIYGLLKDVTSIDEARNMIEKNIPGIDVEVKKSLVKQNYNKDYTIDFGMNYFPKKEFRGITYEEGYYESLVITIGEGKGNNWWCVLFPPLCMLETEDVDTTDIEYKSFALEILNKYLNN